MVYTERTHWTAADLAALPDDGCHYELVKGHLIRMPPRPPTMERPAAIWTRSCACTRGGTAGTPMPRKLDST